MPSLEIHPLSELRDEAAALLAERYTRQRAAESLLPEVTDFESHIPAAGHVATRGGRAVAYLAGAAEGGVARAGFAGCAASEPEALGDVFAVSAQVWDVSRFAVALPASEKPLVDAFFRLAFGCQLVWGVREIDLSGGVEVRLHECRFGTRDDLPAVVELEQSFQRFSHTAPSLSDLRLQSAEEVASEWQGTWDDPAFTHFVCERDGAVAGHLLLYRRPGDDLRVPVDSIDIALTATAERARGEGIGRSLFAHAVAWAKENGFRSLTVDFRTVNLLASRFWTNRGFRPQYLRLYRAVP